MAFSEWYASGCLLRFVLSSTHLVSFILGLFCCTWYHFFVHDVDGPIGTFLRRLVPSLIMGGLDDATFGVVVVGGFMQICGLLQMPMLLGPSFSPFTASIALCKKLFQKLPKAQVNLVPEGAPSAVKVASNGTAAVVITSGAVVPPSAKRKRRPRNKKKEL